VLGALLLLTVSACGGGTGGPPDGAAGGSQDASASAGAGDDGLLEPQAPPAKKLSFTGAGPGSGSFTDGLCAVWAWNTETAGEVLTGGVTFVVAEIRFDPDAAVTTRAGCTPGDVPWCEAGTRLSSDSTSCQFGVEPAEGASGVLVASLWGSIDCGDATTQRCADAVAAVQAAPASGANLELPAATDDGGGSGDGGTGDGGAGSGGTDGGATDSATDGATDGGATAPAPGSDDG